VEGRLPWEVRETPRACSAGRCAPARPIGW
jgi:hypothetical protein